MRLEAVHGIPDSNAAKAIGFSIILALTPFAAIKARHYVEGLSEIQTRQPENPLPQVSELDREPTEFFQGDPRLIFDSDLVPSA